ncbi:MAG: hypothetical protein ACXWF5_09425 [Actinomycetota bacterium]
MTILPAPDARSSDPSAAPSSAYVRAGTGPIGCNAVVAGSLGGAEAGTVAVGDPVPDGDADGVVAVLVGGVLTDPEHAASSEIRMATAERRMFGVMGKRSDDDHTPGGRIGGRRRALLPMLAGLAVLASLTPAVARPIPGGRVGVGDSIMLSAKDALNGYDTHVHAKVGRQFSEGVAVVQRLKEDGILAKRVIVHLGTNGPIDPVDCDQVVAIAGPLRRVFLVTNKVPRDWQAANNDILNACASTYDNVWVIRWYAYATGHPHWFADDRYHLSAEGQAIYAAFIDAEVRRVLAV